MNNKIILSISVMTIIVLSIIMLSISANAITGKIDNQRLENVQCQEICNGGAINFELLIDRSGSMNRMLDPPEGSSFLRIIKMQSAREAAKTLAEGAIKKNNQTKIGILTF
jgi:hypothetical protein